MSKETKRIYHAQDGTELYLRCNLVDNAKAVVVIVHGAAEHQGRYDWVVSKLNEYGFTTYRYDNRGHGRSGGARGYLSDYNLFYDDLNEIVELAKKENPGLKIFTLGHSMGSFISSGYGMKYPGQVAGQLYTGMAYLASNAVSSFEGKDLATEGLETVLNVLGDNICSTPGVKEDYESDPWNLMAYTKALFITMAAGMKYNQANASKNINPTIIYHGEKDVLCLPASAEAYINQVGATDKKLIMYPGMYHEVLNEDAIKGEILESMRDWINDRL